MNRLVRIALITLAKAAIASVTVAQIPAVTPFDAAAVLGTGPLSPVAKSGPTSNTILFTMTTVSGGHVCGYVDRGQAPIGDKNHAYVPFYAFTNTHFGARHQLRAVPFLTFDSAKAAVVRECN